MPAVTESPSQKSILKEAQELVNGERHNAYGDYRLNFERWAAMCRGAGVEVTPAQLATIMVCGKLARQANGHKRDNLVDAAGYLELLARFNQ